MSLTIIQLHLHLADFVFIQKGNSQSIQSIWEKLQRKLAHSNIVVFKIHRDCYNNELHTLHQALTFPFILFLNERSGQLPSSEPSPLVSSSRAPGTAGPASDTWMPRSESRQGSARWGYNSKRWTVNVTENAMLKLEQTKTSDNVRHC